MIRDWIRRTALGIGRFRADRSGNVVVIFALSSTVLLLAAGGGIDLVRTYDASQKLTEVADLACQYASRPSIIQTASASYSGSNGSTTYVNNVKTFITTSLASQKFEWTQTNSTPFSYVAGGAASVSLSSTVPTLFAGIVHIPTVAIAASAHCYDSPSSVAQLTPTASNPYIVREGFESTSLCSATVCYINKSGANGSTPAPATPNTANGTYYGQYGNIWVIGGYCIETDRVGAIKSTVPEGVRSAELDCDNGSGSAGNSSLSTNVYLSTGSYEIRYNYASRVDYPNYDPAYICGTTASDVNWANDTYSPTGPVQAALRTNQMNVYLDLNSTGSPPLHTTIDGKIQLGGSNLIDSCVYAPNWIERSVRLNITTAGYYWLTFAADGQNDSYGAQLDNMRLCFGTCPGSVGDSFPAAWTSSKLLFGDTFDSPAYTGTNSVNTSGNMSNSKGTSGSASGWPTLAASGWANAPVNQIPYWTSGCPQGTQCLQMGSGSTNSLISRPFLLDPGYYRIDYSYVSEFLFSGLTSTYCGATPTLANLSALSAVTAMGKNRVQTKSQASFKEDTNTVGLFVSHAQLTSTANISTTLGATTSYNNPDGSTSTTPTVAPNAISLTSYNASQNNPLLDICGYASTAQARSATIQIVKPAYYWLTFAGLGAADAAGGQIDDVKLTALGSLYGAAPTGSIAIPTPMPAPGSPLSFSNGGFSVTADPLTAPAP